MSDEITLRDTFAAAALTGLLAQGDDGSFSEESYARAAYRWADAMLRGRGDPKEKLAEFSYTLTAEEREAIEDAIVLVDYGSVPVDHTKATLRKLLERMK
jgi:hypothetical protein